MITAGAALTALHYSCLKLVRGEESYITKDYFRSFKRNFGQATLIWLIFLVIGALLVFDLWYMLLSGLAEDPNMIVLAGIFLASLFYLFTLAFVFPVQSHFINPIGKTIKNSFLISIMALPKTILIIALWLVPAVIMYFIDQAFLLCVLFWFSVPAYIAALLYNKTFKKFEPEGADSNDDFTWSVNSDVDGDPDAEVSDSQAENTNENVEEAVSGAIEDKDTSGGMEE